MRFLALSCCHIQWVLTGSRMFGLAGMVWMCNIQPFCLQFCVLWTALSYAGCTCCVAVWKRTCRKVTGSNWSLRALGIWSIYNPKQHELKGVQQTGSVADWSSSAISSVDRKGCWEVNSNCPSGQAQKLAKKPPRSFWIQTLAVQGEDLPAVKAQPRGTDSTGADDVMQLNTHECSVCDAISSLQVLRLNFTPTLGLFIFSIEG